MGGEEDWGIRAGARRSGETQAAGGVPGDPRLSQTRSPRYRIPRPGRPWVGSGPSQPYGHMEGAKARVTLGGVAAARRPSSPSPAGRAEQR